MSNIIGGSIGTPIFSDTQILSERVSEKYINWIKQEFQPLTLATPDETIVQAVENAIRYWNTHSAYKAMETYDFTPGEKVIQLNAQFKSVVDVLPARRSTWLWSDHPLWTLLGITVIDNVTSDLIMLSESYRNYRVYVGADMRWEFIRPDNYEDGGKLFLINVPSGVAGFCVVGTKRIVKDEDIQNEFVLEWLLRYIKALVKMCEGNILRKSSIIGIKNDGQELMNEGKEEQKELQEELSKTARWTAFVRRG